MEEKLESSEQNFKRRRPNEESLDVDESMNNVEEFDELNKNFFCTNQLKVYYKRLFPYAEMFEWLSYGVDHFFFQREFAYTFANDVFARYQSFNSLDRLSTSISQENPFKIDIGAIYNIDPAKRLAYQNGKFFPVERELVFDVDITDYDDVRNCCKNDKICSLCFPLMIIAIKVINTSLKEDFGFNHIFWVFSGRRGVHCWVCDKRARILTDEQRSSIAEYFRVCEGNENNSKKVSFKGSCMHPSLMRAYENELIFFFENEYINSQNLFYNLDNAQVVLNMIPDNSLRERIIEKWQNDKNKNSKKIYSDDINTIRWNQMKDLIKSSMKKNNALRGCIESIIFYFTYPRLDLEVSKKMNHLLKSPFCIHPKTGKVCIPIDAENCENFDVNKVPTLSQLIHEINTFEQNGDEINFNLKDIEKTSLKSHVDFFRTSFLNPLLQDIKTNNQKKTDAKFDW